MQRPLTPLQVRCFQEACALPVGVEISKPDEEGNFYVTDKESGLAADAEALRRAPPSAGPAASGTVVVLDGRPLVVDSVPGASSPSAWTPAPTTTSSEPAWSPAQIGRAHV